MILDRINEAKFWATFFKPKSNNIWFQHIEPVIGVCGEDDVAGEDDDQLGEGEVHQQPVDRGPELQQASWKKWSMAVQGLEYTIEYLLLRMPESKNRHHPLQNQGF